jgi:hypothetical protein
MGSLVRAQEGEQLTQKTLHTQRMKGFLLEHLSKLFQIFGTVDKLPFFEALFTISFPSISLYFPSFSIKTRITLITVKGNS